MRKCLATNELCPKKELLRVVKSPEGKVFSGWMIEETDEAGQPIMNVVFQPDEDGVVAIPSEATLEPMTLYPYFEDAA